MLQIQKVNYMFNNITSEEMDDVKFYYFNIRKQYEENPSDDSEDSIQDIKYDVPKIRLCF